jgi:hypothetical protein
VYNADQKKVLEAYGQMEKEALYLFFVKEVQGKEGVLGYMPLQYQAGFIYDDPDATIIAHELAHGAFNLWHTFSSEQFIASQGATANLMDYNNGVELWKHQWQLIDNPKNLWFKAWQDEEEGEANINIHLALTPDGNFIDKFYLLEDGKEQSILATLLVEDGQYAIGKIRYSGKNYDWSTSCKCFINGSEKITVKKDDKKPNKVNLFKHTGESCEYEYLEIAWNEEDENAPDIRQTILSKISEDLKWVLYPYTERNISCDINFIKDILSKDRSGCAKEDVDSGDKLLKDNLNQTDPTHLVNVVNSVCLSSLRKLAYNEKVTLFKAIAQQEKLKEHSELALLRIMNSLYAEDYKMFYKLLEDNNNKLIKHLVEEMDDASIYFWTDKNNYTNFIGALITMFATVPESYLDRFYEEGNEKLLNQIFNVNPKPFKSDFSANIFSGEISLHKYRYNGQYDFSNGNITIVGEEKRFLSNMPQEIWVPIDNITSESISPLTPIIITTDKELPLVETALGKSAGIGDYYIVPAIFFKFKGDKEFNEAMESSAVIILDVVTIASSSGAALALKIHWARRVWAIMEVAGAIGDIAVNVANINSELKSAIDAYNLAMGIIGVKNIGKGVVNFAKQIPREVKELIKNNNSIRSLVAAKYRDWKVALYGIDELTEAEQKLLAEQMQIWRALDISSNSAINSINDFWAKIPVDYLSNVQKAFDGIPTTVKYAEKDMILYRHCNNNSPQISNWYTNEMLSPASAKTALALPINNTAERIVKIKVPGGTPYIEGKVANQVNNPSGLFDNNAIGGGHQFYFLAEHKMLLQIIEDIPNPIK